MLVSNTDAPQGCVLSPFVYTLYTNDYRSVDQSTQFVTFYVDTAMLALWVILPHTSHIFLQWYVSLVGAVKNSASECFQNERNVHRLPS